MAQGPVGGQMGALRAEDARVYGAQKAADMQAQAVAEQQAAVNRRPARGGVQFDLDPLTGKLVPASSTLEGATPDINVIESTGHSLSRAVDKMTGTTTRNAAGEKVHIPPRPFDMTPEERIAWTKTKVDLADVSPDLRGLSDKAIATKMMDRQWVQDTIKKLREKDAAFAEIDARRMAQLRAQDASFKGLEAQMAAQRVMDAAAAKRAALISHLEDVQDNLATPRSISRRTVQGPVTRNFLAEQSRNRLSSP